MMSFPDHIWNMTLALEEADVAYKNDEVPIGAVVVDSSGKVLAKASNDKEKSNDPCGHAEIIAIRKAAEAQGAWRLSGCTLYVTLEPCPMCLAAMVQARVSNVVFGAYDRKGGAISLGYDLFKDSRLNHRFSVMGGIKHFECSRVLSNFFRAKRRSYKFRA
jgi:tRNA(adenine34) deaminase